MSRGIALLPGDSASRSCRDAFCAFWQRRPIVFHASRCVISGTTGSSKGGLRGRRVAAAAVLDWHGRAREIMPTEARGEQTVEVVERVDTKGGVGDNVGRFLL